MQKSKTILFSIFLLMLFSLTNEMPYSEVGLASYYSSKFEGKRTASGIVFRQDSLTCAHKHLKFGSVLKVVNLKNDSTIFVTVNDRLSKKSKFIIDVSLRGAKQLNFVRQGMTKVQIEEITK